MSRVCLLLGLVGLLSIFLPINVMCQDAVTATLLEEVLSLKEEVYNLKDTIDNSCSCSSGTSIAGDINIGNLTATVKYAVFNGDSCLGDCTISTNYGVSYIAQNYDPGQWTVNWETPFLSNNYVVTCNANLLVTVKLNLLIIYVFD